MESVGERPPNKTSDDVVRTVIFLFGTSFAIYLLFAYNSIISVVAGLVFLSVGGQNMRQAFFPFGRIVESSFWVIFATVGLIAALVFRAFGQTEASFVSVLMAMLVIYSIFDTHRSIQTARKVIKMRDQVRRNRDNQAP